MESVRDKLTTDPITKIEDVRAAFVNTNFTDFKMIESRQADFDETLTWMTNTTDVYNNNHSSLKNALRQANSLKLVFDAINMDEEYDAYMFLRSDVYLYPLVNISELLKYKNKLVVPSWQTYGGVNDRVAFTCNRSFAQTYSRRGQGYEKILLSRKNPPNTEGMVIFEKITFENIMF